MDETEVALELNETEQSTTDEFSSDNLNLTTKPIPFDTPQKIPGDSSIVGTFNFGNDIEYLKQVLLSIKNIVACSACFLSLIPMKECTNGHLICQSCYLILRQFERPQCPVCRIGLHSEPKKGLVAEKIMSELPESCMHCGIILSKKDLNNHQLSDCPKRRVTCNYSHLGCTWIGNAEESFSHHLQCKVSKDTSISEIADYVARKEQSWNEIFQSFFSVLRRLESTDPQYRTVALSFIKSTSDTFTFRSDQFHCNQSRWSLEVRFYQINDSEENYVSDDIGYRFTKENGVGNSRRHYGFVLMSIKTDDNVKIYLRPQLNFTKFTIRGQVTEFFTASNVEIKLNPRNCHIIHVEIGVIRKTEDNDD